MRQKAAHWAKVETETLNNKMGVAKSETLVNTEAHTLPKGKPELVVHTLADTLAKTKSETLGDTLNDVKPEPLVETLRLETVGVILIDIQPKTVTTRLLTKYESRRLKQLATHNAISKLGSGRQLG